MLTRRQHQRMLEILNWLSVSEKECPEIATNLLRRGKSLVRLFFPTPWQECQKERVRQAKEALRELLPEFKNTVLPNLSLMQLEEELKRIRRSCSRCPRKNWAAIINTQMEFKCGLTTSQLNPNPKYILDKKGQLKRIYRPS